MADALASGKLNVYRSNKKLLRCGRLLGRTGRAGPRLVAEGGGREDSAPAASKTKTDPGIEEIWLICRALAVIGSDDPKVMAALEHGLKSVRWSIYAKPTVACIRAKKRGENPAFPDALAKGPSAAAGS